MKGSAYASSIGRSAKKRMHERFDDFGEDFLELLEREHKSTKVWVDCQNLWWKQQLRKETSGDFYHMYPDVYIHE